jgi:hypothetical protein
MTVGTGISLLKDEEGQIRCVMFRGRNGQVGFMPQSGDLVEVSASLGMYVPRGDVQLTIQTLRRAGMGGLYEAFLKLESKASKEGLFDEDRKREIPTHPKINWHYYFTASSRTQRCPEYIGKTRASYSSGDLSNLGARCRCTSRNHFCASKLLKKKTQSMSFC